MADNYTVIPEVDLAAVAEAEETLGISLLAAEANASCLVTFTCHEGGTRTYRYTGSAATAIMAGDNPSDYQGELVRIDSTSSTAGARGSHIATAVAGSALGVLTYGARKFAEYRNRNKKRGQ